MTRRAYYSLQNGYNTVNKERMSPSYEFRLSKYAFRGMPIMVPHFTWERYELFNYRLSKIREMKAGRAIREMLKEEKNSGRHGLVYLLLMGQMIQHRPSGAAQMLRTGKIVSDYGSAYNDGHPFNINLMEKILGRRYNEFYRESQDADNSNIKITTTNVTTMTTDGLVSGISIVSYVTREDDMMFDSNDVPEGIMALDDDLFEFIKKYYLDYPPQTIQYKVVRPGEQATGSFHKTVLINPAAWWGQEGRASVGINETL